MPSIQPQTSECLRRRRPPNPHSVQPTPSLSLAKQPGSRTWGQRALWRRLVDIGSHSNPQVFLLSLAQQPAPGLRVGGAARGLGSMLLGLPTSACFPS